MSHKSGTFSCRLQLSPDAMLVELGGGVPIYQASGCIAGLSC
jgi:hypothetical protein